MDSIFILITIIIAIILLLFINKNNLIDINLNQKYNPTIYENLNSNKTSYSLIGNEENYKDFIDGYENELMYENNLKGGDYVKQFKEIDFSNIPKSNNQIGFNPQPRETNMVKIPFADINVNCL